MYYYLILKNNRVIHRLDSLLLAKMLFGSEKEKFKNLILVREKDGVVLEK